MLKPKQIKELQQQAEGLAFEMLAPKNDYQRYIISRLIQEHELYKYLQLKEYHGTFKMEMYRYYTAFKNTILS